MGSIASWLKQTTQQLKQSGVESARLDALILLEDCVGKDRAWLLAHPEHDLAHEQTERMEHQIEQRKHHTPLAYIRGKSEFYGRTFYINSNVLEPRPETEDMIDLTMKLIKNDAYKVIDIGTGSGAIAITVKLELPKTEVFAIDIDHKCLEVARHNAQTLNADINLLRGDFAEPLQRLDLAEPLIILANLPYVPNNYTINQAASHEPRLAIFGGDDGLESYQKMFDQLSGLKTPPNQVITESLLFQHDQLATIAHTYKYKLQKTQGLAQQFNLAK
jgi:release factor glutamine methyltransferase